MRAMCLVLVTMGLIGCVKQPQVDTLGQAARNVSRGLPEQSRLLMCLVAASRPCAGMPGPSDRDVVRSHVRDNATLSCDIATHDDQASAPTSPACQCAQATSPEQFETACAAWAGVQ